MLNIKWYYNVNPYILQNVMPYTMYTYNQTSIFLTMFTKPHFLKHYTPDIGPYSPTFHTPDDGIFYLPFAMAAAQQGGF